MDSNSEDDYDLFVSYASTSNDLPAPFNGWVSQFVDALRRTLRANLGGRDLRIYFDLRVIEPNQPLTDILDICRRSSMFLAIASPAYHARAWPAQELEAFLSTHDDTRRLFIAELQPSRADRYLPQLRERRMTHFHRLPTSADAREAIPILPGSELFYERISDLSASICAQLERLRAPVVGAPTSRAVGMSPAATAKPLSASAIPPASPLATVLLAQVTDDLEDERESVRRYLEQYRVVVLPAGDYPQGGETFQAAYAADLANCTLVVQLLGARPGRTPPDLAAGYVRHQAQAARSANVKLMQWRRSDLDVEQVADAGYRELLGGETVTASTLEQFKSDLLATLRKPPPTVKERHDFLVFVDAEKADRPAARKMRDALAATCSVVLPLDDADGSVQDDFNENLRECDALLLVYGDARPDWVRAQLRHLRKARAGQPFPQGAICYGPPRAKPQVDFTMPGFNEIDCRSGDGSEWALEPIRTLFASAKP